AFYMEQREACGFYNHSQADAERRRLQGDIIALKEVDRIIGLPNPAERESRLKDLRIKLDSFLSPS
ncbi:MAG: hypothetical protein PHU23_10455, partial [Dehalococcoidales bacterium]|nr:hypothetical protein [Dehalococcoidales bacterium]